MKRLSQSQIAEHKKKLLKTQAFKCGLCGIDMSTMATRDLCLDHDHKCGHVRAVLCRNCNGIEGKIFNLANRGKRGGTVESFLVQVIKYWREYAHSNTADIVYHPSHKTVDEKRLERNRKARRARARKAATKNVKGK